MALRQRRGQYSSPDVWKPGLLLPQTKIRVDNLPPGCGRERLYDHFNKFGNIAWLRINYPQPGSANICFCPPPENLHNLFHAKHTLYDQDTGSPYGLRLSFLDHYLNEVSSPLDPRRKFPGELVLRPTKMNIGTMTGEQEMLALRGIESDHATQRFFIRVHINRAPEIKVQFPAIRHGAWRTCEIRSYFSNVLSVHRASGPGSSRILTMTFVHPPKVFCQRPTDWSVSIPGEEDRWGQNDYFQRVTDMDRDEHRRDRKLTAVVRSPNDAFVDPGRWLTWSFQFRLNEYNEFAVPKFLDILSAYNVRIDQGNLSTRRLGLQPPIWYQFDRDDHIKQVTSTSALQTLQRQSSGFPVLDFETRYGLEVCISKGYIYEGSVTTTFLSKLAESGPFAVTLLENLVLAEQKLFDPMLLFAHTELRSRRKRRVPKTCVLMHSVTVTPTAMYVQPVQVEVSNRVIRQFIHLSDRFLRVRFTDELYYDKLLASRYDDDTDAFNRVRRTLINGIRLAGRQYKFLACGSSQFREHGAYFFSPNESVDVNTIRQWMGYFHNIREIPKYVSRIGQCFSTTRAVTSIGLEPDIAEIPDIVRNGYTFSDGVGKLSGFLSHMVAQELRLGPDAPSLYQFRMGGCKGVLAVDPTLTGRKVQIRPSQMKFQTDYNQLEIIRWSSFASAYLNRQIILVLSALGISDDVFVTKILTQLTEINLALEHDDIAIQMLQANVDFNQITVHIAKMLQAGMRRDPFVDSMLLLWRAWMKNSLKHKANMFIPKGAFLLGTVDETACLRMDRGKLPEIFLQVPEQGGEHRVVEGKCIILRNPALHPGDIRIVNAVKCPKLMHLKDVVVLPQLGERDLANMCSGGDLDGDDYLIIWDPELIPSECKEPMDYTGPSPVLSKGPVTQSDIIKFFCDFMKNDSLGSIAVAHRAWADKLDDGVNHPRCVELAQLHSQAVDYCKTGVPAQMRPEMQVDKYPHWCNKPPYRSYKSTKVLGKLYDKVDQIEFKPIIDEHGFDKDILQAYPELDEELYREVQTIKAEYDVDVRRIMASFEINTEFEVWSAFAMSHSREIKAYKLAENLGRLMNNLKHHYRDVLMEVADIKLHDKDIDKLGRLIVTAYAITAQQVDRFRAEQAVDAAATEDRQPPMISFPWLFQDELLGVATMVKKKIPLAEALIQNTLTAKDWRSAPKVDRVTAIKDGDLVYSYTASPKPTARQAKSAEINGQPTLASPRTLPSSPPAGSRYGTPPTSPPVQDRRKSPLDAITTVISEMQHMHLSLPGEIPGAGFADFKDSFKRSANDNSESEVHSTIHTPHSRSPSSSNSSAPAIAGPAPASAGSMDFFVKSDGDVAKDDNLSKGKGKQLDDNVEDEEEEFDVSAIQTISEQHVFKQLSSLINRTQ